MNQPEKFDRLCTITLTHRQKIFAGNALLQAGVRIDRQLRKMTPGTPEHDDLKRMGESISDLHGTLLCYYKLGPHAFTLEADTIAHGSDLADLFALEESDHD